MPISATGISTTSAFALRRAARGFTLVEILVVVLIIGIVSAGAILALGIGGQDRGLDNERDRLLALMAYAREQAELQTREYGLRWHDRGYEFLVFDTRGQEWERINSDDVLRNRRLPAGLTWTLRVEGREIVLPTEKDKDKTKLPVPQVMLFSSGDMNQFAITVERGAGPRGFRIVPSEAEDEIIAVDLPEVKR